MMRSLYSGVAGLKTHQTKMDVIGNNIANVNTVGFKSSSVTFSDIMYQTTQQASGANATTGTGGVNAKQIGLGVSTAATKVSITSSGAAETTGNAFDIMLNDANATNFFIVNNGTENIFTRDGSFYVDNAGNLCMASTGYNVMGWQVDENGNIVKDTVSALRIMQPANLTSAPEATTAATASGIIDKNDPNLEDGLAMNLTIYDNLGYSYIVKFSITSTGNDGVYSAEITSVTDSDGNDVMAAAGLTSADIVNNGTANGTFTLSYSTADGSFAGVDGDANDTDLVLNLTALGDSFADVTVDFTDTQNVDNGKLSTIGVDSGDSDGYGAGKKLGAMTGVSIDNTGKIYGTYDNGNTVLLGQIAVAQFANASGLEALGDNCYATTLNSGEFDGIGVDISADGGSMTTGALEMSNVDLSSEFTSMITTQRGFQANSRIITTSDSMLEELINLKR
ncbi:flagellar hook protein FlgE [Eubacterium oxidoreducens]|uniref:Flagellar hook protein FlgE n=1 Tax=Eubacterium oxidoreducens TaxID=1732 RepID=A0A1G6AQ01_EUBOX|nr:flagellar hook-basal body complex protein [Eubacterium oxidoreducens]SDB10484.1 flagellar hook protein FlgE [Eubacterium oxidoreducens]